MVALAISAPMLFIDLRVGRIDLALKRSTKPVISGGAGIFAVELAGQKNAARL
jgi:hypothetical protein